jgi:hypothetical protein
MKSQHTYDEIRVRFDTEAGYWKLHTIRGDQRNIIPLAVKPEATIREAIEVAIQATDWRLTVEDFTFDRDDLYDTFAFWEREAVAC